MKTLFYLRAYVLIALVLVAPHRALRAEGATPIGYQGAWTAKWIAIPDAPAFYYGVYHFRRSFSVESKPAKFIIHTSADNRYQLFVNGTRVAWGPARGDLNHWRYETVDIAPHMKAGRNTLAAVVWNFSDLAPEAQLTYRTGFLLQGDTKFEQPLVDTNAAWRCVRNMAYSPRVIEPKEILYQYMVVGPGDAVDAAKYPWGWEQPDFNDASWSFAREVGAASPRESRLPHATRWFLVPRTIPPMEEQPERLSRVRSSGGIVATEGFLKGTSPLVVAANTRARVLLDQDKLTTAYPELMMSGGRGASLRVRYAENLWTPGKMEKSHRDQIEGKEFRGNEDFFVTDGGARRTFRPLWWRCYRYIELDIETKDEPLTVDDIRATHVSFPFVRKARFASDAPELERIIETGWRTLRLGAHETYQDSPYYEQMQYVGDARIEALISYYMAGDDRLARNAIEHFNDSRIAEGLTMSRAPSRFPQYIPTFSLIWIGMVHDWWRYRDDAELARRMLPGVRSVLGFFAERQKPDSSLGVIPFWVFVDWVKEFPTGAPPGWNFNSSWNSNADMEGVNRLAARVPLDDPRGASSILDLQLALAYSWAADLEAALGSQSQADEYRMQARRIRLNAQKLYWNAQRQMYADTPAHASFSQHANVLAILNDMLGEANAKALLMRVTQDSTLAQCSTYFRFYLHSAVNEAGAGDRLIELLEPWRVMLSNGLTTWSETATNDSRSDSHAWAASPNYEIFRTVLGIDSAAPGFRRVVVRPFLGKLRNASGAIPHPKGEVAVDLKMNDDGALDAEVNLPEGVTGEFIWYGKRRSLSAGKNTFMIKRQHE